MTFCIVRKERLWCVDDLAYQVGGIFVDLASAIRFIRRCENSARIVVRAPPSDL